MNKEDEPFLMSKSMASKEMARNMEQHLIEYRTEELNRKRVPYLNQAFIKLPPNSTTTSKTPSKTLISFDVHQEAGLDELKCMIQQKTGIPVELQNLYSNGRCLPSTEDLCHRLPHGSVVDVILSLKGGARPVATLVVGNPGVGKSTLLNGLLQKVRFKSGINLGSGVTTVFDVYIDEQGNKFCDTPGLNDVALRKQAASEISKALKQGGLFKVIFSITLEDGRIRPDDKTTMKLVLDAAPDIGSSYSVIINKVQPEVAELFKSEETVKKFVTLMNDGLPGTRHFMVNDFDPTLSGKNNQLSPLLPKMLEFLMQAPIVHIQPENVSKVKEDLFEEERERYRSRLDAFEKEKERLNSLEKQRQKEIRVRNDKARLVKQAENCMHQIVSRSDSGWERVEGNKFLGISYFQDIYTRIKEEACNMYNLVLQLNSLTSINNTTLVKQAENCKHQIVSRAGSGWERVEGNKFLGISYFQDITTRTKEEAYKLYSLVLQLEKTN